MTAPRLAGRWPALRTAAALAAVALLGAFSAAPRAQSVVLDVGSRAPVFQGTTSDGQPWRSRDHVGRRFVVVYFYPAAMTGGCTEQACAFRDNRSQLQALGAEVVGVSGDRAANLRTFARSNRLNFPLVADTRGRIARAFGVPVGEGGRITRTVDGREVELTRDVTAARWTFIIGRDGRIAYKDTDVDPAGDGEAVVAALRRLSRG
ncbi:MAG TPA: peroxiredoxin [Rubricoccaceae bacterium]|jgi:peroxiredoxin Q/BCP